jgi:hypothetical protein
MSGYPNFNFAAFHQAEVKLQMEGWVVFNPAAKDIENHPGIMNNPEGDPMKAVQEHGFDFREAFLWDIEKIIKGDAIYMLRGWEQSSGATAEHKVATAMQKHYPKYEILYEE